MRATTFAAEEYPGADPWKFALFDVRCRCGWYLADVEPVMSPNGVVAVLGVCKRHGIVKADAWDICDVEDEPA